MTKAVFVFWSVCLFSFTVRADPSEGATGLHHRVYRSYVEGNVTLWAETIEQYEQLYAAWSRTEDLYSLLLARYGYTGSALERGEKTVARAHLSRARRELELLMHHSEGDARAWALRGGIKGFHILLRPLEALRLGPESSRALDHALELDPREPLAWLERANALFHRPALFGGSKEGARDSYREAVRLFEEDLKIREKWLYLNSLVGLARSLCHIGEIGEGVAVLETVLTIEPDLNWVREKLLPALAAGNCQGESP
ncbi:hypothetical protein SAMN05920897_11197 [Alkalispirochaeta americana]|uniref:Tetratricopeptide repeat-containing protein n=1 Tax=Alkalispirochaeta americana TaxID=159291 RepID=A0A1N6U484_9SPIO|nr:hypothetical protein [Alkalispirochaeta americana]SIQ60347.1 hypothetical protein SAMN05920897_11197 [Alkalispirochaeta americana]